MSGGNEVTVNPGSNRKHQVGGTDNKEGVAMLVADSGRKNFAAPLHPVVTVTATVSSLNELVKAQFSNLTDAKRSALGMSASDFTPSIYASRGFLLKALASNNGLIYLGTQHILAETSGTTADAVGFVLEAGSSVFIEITEAANIYFQSVDGDESLCWLAL